MWLISFCFFKMYAFCKHRCTCTWWMRIHMTLWCCYKRKINSCHVKLKFCYYNRKSWNQLFPTFWMSTNCPLYQLTLPLYSQNFLFVIFICAGWHWTLLPHLCRGVACARTVQRMDQYTLSMPSRGEYNFVPVKNYWMHFINVDKNTYVHMYIVYL